MQATLHKQSIISRQFVIPLVILGIIILYVLFAGNSGVLALIITSIIFVLGLRQPILAMAAFIITQITIPSFMVGSISLRLLILLLIGLIIWREQVTHRIQLGNGAKRLIISLCILMLITTLANLFSTSFSFLFKDFRNYLSGTLIAIFLPAIVRNLQDFKLLCRIIFIGLGVSTLLALMQHSNLLGLGSYLSIPGRVQGISENELQLSYLLCIGFLVVLGLFFTKAADRNKWGTGILTFFMLPALYFTYTRSALIALLFGLLAIFLFWKTRLKSEIIFIVILLATLVISITGITDSFSFSARSQGGQEASSIERKILWQAGIAIARDNPILGIGGDRFMIVAPQYTDAVDPSLIKWEEDRYYSYRTLGSTAVHNDFLDMWVSYGIFALFVFIWIFMVILRNCINAFLISKQRFIKGFSLGLAAGLISYIVNAFYHNLLAEMPIFFILAGFSIVVVKLTAETLS